MKHDLPIPAERGVQRSILRMAGVCFRDVFVTHVPNGAHLAGDDHQRRIKGGKLIGDGMKKGFPDLLCLWAPGKGAMIEVKRPKLGRLSDEQKAMQAKLIELCWPVAICTSAEEAYAFLRQCGAPCSAELM